jgi:hypothetical protein
MNGGRSDVSDEHDAAVTAMCSLVGAWLLWDAD